MASTSHGVKAPYEPGLARHSDPETSKQAAALDTSAVKAIVVNALRTNGPGTTKQIAAWTGLELVTVSPRMVDLENRGLVVRDGKRLNSPGHWATVWRAVAA